MISPLLNGARFITKGYDNSMKVNPDQLPQYFQRVQQAPSVFLLSGDEPLQLMEAADVIRSYAKKLGFSERDVIHVDSGSFDWSLLAGASNALSLFSDKKLIDLRLEIKSPGKKGSEAIRNYMKNPPTDKILLMQMGKLDRGMRNSAWVKAIEKDGVLVQVWDLSTPQTMAWVAKRLRENGMHASSDAVRLLTERVEGNLLAATQEIAKLKLLYQPKEHAEGSSQQTEINEQQILSAVSDSSRYSIFDLSNAVMLGDTHRVQHIHHNLHQEGVPITLLLWTLGDLNRQLYQASFSLRNGTPVSQILSKMPRPRQKPFQIALQRMQHADWISILQMNSRIDKLSKGQGETSIKGTDRIWAELLELALVLSGSAVLHAKAS
jgi:DNA polymerase-3 subunit delta